MHLLFSIPVIMIYSTKLLCEVPTERRTVSYKRLHLILEKVSLIIVFCKASELYAKAFIPVIMIYSTKLLCEVPTERRTVSYKRLHLILEKSQFDNRLLQGF